MIPEETLQKNVIDAILLERKRQDDKWGKVKHDPYTWEIIALEEFGEVAKAMLEHGNIREELIQTAAVLVAWLEDEFERGEFENMQEVKA